MKAPAHDRASLDYNRKTTFVVAPAPATKPWPSRRSGLCCLLWASHLERVAEIGVGFTLGVTRWGPTRPRSFHLVTTSMRPVWIQSWPQDSDERYSRCSPSGHDAALCSQAFCQRRRDFSEFVLGRRLALPQALRPTPAACFSGNTCRFSAQTISARSPNGRR